MFSSILCYFMLLHWSEHEEVSFYSTLLLYFSYQSIMHYKKQLKNKGGPFSPASPFTLLHLHTFRKNEGTIVFIFLNAISDLIKSRERFRGHANLMHNFIVIQTPLDAKSYVHKLKTVSVSVGVCFSVNIKILQKSVLTQFIRKEYPCLFNFWSR